MILAKAREEDKDFYEVLDYYLEMIRGLHLRTYEFLGTKERPLVLLPIVKEVFMVVIYNQTIKSPLF